LQYNYEQTFLDDIPLFYAVKDAAHLLALADEDIYILDLSGKVNSKIKLGLTELEHLVDYKFTILSGKLLFISYSYADENYFYTLHSVDLNTHKITKTDFSDYVQKNCNLNDIYLSDFWVSARDSIIIEVCEGDFPFYYFESTDLVEWNNIAITDIPDELYPENNIAAAAGIQYRIDDRSSSCSDTYLCVSQDEGVNWSEMSLGTNYGRSIIVDNDTVWVACYGYHEQVFILSSNMIGGGLHQFRWSYETAQ